MLLSTRQNPFHCTKIFDSTCWHSALNVRLCTKLSLSILYPCASILILLLSDLFLILPSVLYLVIEKLDTTNNMYITVYHTIDKLCQFGLLNIFTCSRKVRNNRIEGDRITEYLRIGQISEIIYLCLQKPIWEREKFVNRWRELVKSALHQLGGLWREGVREREGGVKLNI